MKYKEKLIKGSFWLWLHILQEVTFFGLVLRIIISSKIKITNKLVYLDLIIVYLKKRRVEVQGNKYMYIHI